jgi:hypothetical protein
MNPRICICCGEPLMDEGNTLSRNPNVCASCSSMADGMDECGVPLNDLSADPESAALSTGSVLAPQALETGTGKRRPAS